MYAEDFISWQSPQQFFQMLLFRYPRSRNKDMISICKISATLQWCCMIIFQRHTKGSWTSFTTEDLASLDQRHSDAKSEICLMSARILEGLVDSLRQYIPVFLTVSDCISLIDCLRSFAEHISTSPFDSFRRPVFNHSGSLAIKEGRHPLRLTTLN